MAEKRKRKSSIAIEKYEDEQFDDFVDEAVRVLATMWSYRSDKVLDSDRQADLGELLDEFFQTELAPAVDRFVCQNCDSRWAEDDLKDVKDLPQRVAPGEPMPAGECPACGAVCHEET